jgi:hypothetical protein
LPARGSRDTDAGEAALPRGFDPDRDREPPAAPAERVGESRAAADASAAASSPAAPFACFVSSRAVDRDEERVDPELESDAEPDSASEPPTEDDEGEDGEVATGSGASLSRERSKTAPDVFFFSLGRVALGPRADPARGADPGAGATVSEGSAAVRTSGRSPSGLDTTTPRPARSASTRAAARASGDKGGSSLFSCFARNLLRLCSRARGPSADEANVESSSPSCSPSNRSNRFSSRDETHEEEVSEAEAEEADGDGDDGSEEADRAGPRNGGGGGGRDAPRRREPWSSRSRRSRRSPKSSP